MFNRLLDVYETMRCGARCERPAADVGCCCWACSSPAWRIYPFLGLAFFPQTDAGQFTINVKVPTGTRIEVTDQYVAKIEDLIRQIVDPRDLKMIVSNIGVVNDFSSLYTTNAGQYTATIQTALNDDHRVSSLDLHGPRARRSWPPSFPTSARSSRAAPWWTRS